MTNRTSTLTIFVIVAILLAVHLLWADNTTRQIPFPDGSLG
jgi:hypothetical protein